MRPPDGLCAKCHHQLPDEWKRPELTRATDICGRCALGKISTIEREPTAKAWISAWKARHAGYVAVARGYGVMGQTQLQSTGQ